MTDKKRSETLNAIVRVNILDAYDNNKFWILDEKKQLYKGKQQENGMLSDDELIKGIEDGSIKTDSAINRKKILVNESEFFRIVKCLDPDNCIVNGNDYPFLKNILEIKVGRSHKHYDPWFEDKDNCGIIYVNGKRFKKIFCNSSHNRAKKALFIAEELYDKVMEIVLCGIDPHDKKKVNFPCKWEAYNGMCCTDSRPVTMPHIVVIPDYRHNIEEVFDVVSGKIVNNQYEISTDVKTEKREVEIMPFDGAGLVGVELAQKWASELKLDYLPSAWQFRAIPGIKGNVYTFDIQKFAETYHVRKIKDYKDREWDLYDDKIDCILTESQTKFIKMYGNFDDWKRAFDTDLYGYHRTFNTSDVCIPYGKLKNHCIMSYQPPQTLDLTDDEIKTLCEDTVDRVTKVHSDINTFLKWRGLDSEEDRGDPYTNPALQALKYNPSLAKDPYIHTAMITELQNMRRINHIRILVKGNYQVLIPDVFALAESAFDLPVKGLLRAKEVYNKFWINRNVKELDLIRFPHIAKEHCLAYVVDAANHDWGNIQYWYQYQNVGYVTSIWDSFALRMGTADFDNDHIYGVADETIVNALKRQGANTIWFERDPDEATNSKKVTADDYIAMAKSDSVGFSNDIGTVVNNTSKLWSMITPENKDNDKVMDYLKVMSVIDSLTIDFVKSGIKAKVPKEIEKILNKQKNPYFFQFRSDKDYSKEKNVQNNAKMEKQIKKTEVGDISLYSDSMSNMNRIAHYMDSHIATLEAKYDVPEFDWTTMLQGEYDQQGSRVYKNVREKLFNLNKEFTTFRGNEYGNDWDIDYDQKDSQNAKHSHLKLFFEDCKNQLLIQQPNVNKLVNDIIVCYYADQSFVNIDNRGILWNCFFSQMIARAKGQETENKIYDLDRLRKQHDKILEKKKKAKQLADQKRDIPMIDNIDAQISITNADKKYINKQLKTQRSKRLYYALLYIWLKVNAGKEKEQWIKIGHYSKQGQISKLQIERLAGMGKRAYEDALEACYQHDMIDIDFSNKKVIKIKVLYKKQEGKKIELPESCKKMKSWIDRYCPAMHSEDMECIEPDTRYYIKKNREDRSTNVSVVRIEDGTIYSSLSIAAEQNPKTTPSNISSCCRSKKYCKSSGGYHWMYLSDYEQNQNRQDA